MKLTIKTCALLLGGVVALHAQAETEGVKHNRFQTDNLSAETLANPSLLSFEIPTIRDHKRNKLSKYLMYNGTHSMILHADVSDLDLPRISQPKTVAVVNYQELGSTADLTAMCSALFSAQSRVFVNDQAIEQPHLKAQLLQRLQESFNPCATSLQPLNQLFKQVKLSSFDGANQLQSEYLANRKNQRIWVGYDVLIMDENNEQTLVQADEAYEWDLQVGGNAVEQQLNQVMSQMPEMDVMFAQLEDFSTWETKAAIDLVQHEFVKRYGNLNTKQQRRLADFFITTSAMLEASFQSSIEIQPDMLPLQAAFEPVFTESRKLNRFLQTMQTTPEHSATLKTMCNQWFDLITQKIYDHRQALLAFASME